MAQRINWAELQEQFVREHSESGITTQAWCEQHGLNYQSARRYIKLRTAQSELRSAQTSAQLSVRKLRSSSQSAQAEQSAQPKDNGRERGGRSASTSQASTDSDQNSNNNMVSGRDESGRFTEGHCESMGNAGNPNPPSNIMPGMQLTKTHGGYAQFLDADELFDLAEALQLRDELVFTRARVISVTKTMKSLQHDLAEAQELTDRIAIYDKILRAEQALDRNIQRIESIERTLSALRIDEVNGPKIEADTKRIKAATRKLTAEADLLEKDGGADMTPVAEMTAELQGLGTGGLMS